MLVGEVVTVNLPQEPGYSWKITYGSNLYKRAPEDLDVSFSPPQVVPASSASPATNPSNAQQISQSFVFARDVGSEELEYTYSGPPGTDPVVQTLTVNVTGQPS